MGMIPKCPEEQGPKSATVSREASIGLLSSSEIPLLGRLLESRTASTFREYGRLAQHPRAPE